MPNPKSNLWYCSALDLLAQIPPEDQPSAVAPFKSQSLKRKDTFFLSELRQDICIIASGAANLCRPNWIGRRFIEAILSEGDIFGNIYQAESDGQTHTIECLEPTTLLLASREHFNHLLQKYPDFASTVIQQLEDRQRTLSLRLESLMFKPVRQRVIETILYLAKFYGDKCEHGWAVDIRITQQHLADLVGATRQAVNKVMRELTFKFILSRKKRLVCIISLNRLKKLAQKNDFEIP